MTDDPSIFRIVSPRAKSSALRAALRSAQERASVLGIQVQIVGPSGEWLTTVEPIELSGLEVAARSPQSASGDDAPCPQVDRAATFGFAPEADPEGETE